MSPRDRDVLIVGGGIIGSAMAWALAERGFRSVTVVDLDLAGIYASSELNAGGARATWWQTVNVQTCAATLRFFRAHAEEFGFRERGYLWLYDHPERFDRARERMAMQNEHDLGVTSLDVAEITERFPFIDRHTSELVGATYSPRDGLVNPNAVRLFYRRGAEKAGVRFLNRHYVRGVRTERTAEGRRIAWLDVLELTLGDPLDDDGALRDVLTTHRVPKARVTRQQRMACDIVVGCLGAWSPIFSAKVGISDPTQPVRRQISMLRAQVDDVEIRQQVAAMGMMVDASDLYLHPEGNDILAGYSIPTEVPGYDFDYDGERFFVEQIWPRLAHRSSAFERCKHVRGWSGLYAATPDSSGIAGAVPGFDDFYEAHSFTGRGVMQSFGIATALAEYIEAGTSEIDLAPLTRARFGDRRRWLVEDLHI